MAHIDQFYGRKFALTGPGFWQDIVQYKRSKLLKRDLKFSHLTVLAFAGGGEGESLIATKECDRYSA